MKTVFLGTANFGSPYGLTNHVGMSEVESGRVLEWAKGRITRIDSAVDYTDSFNQVRPFARFFEITTKIRLDNSYGPREVDKILESQLRLLGKEHFDILLARCDSGTTDGAKIKIWDHLNFLKSKGKIRHLGFSVYNASEVAHCAKNLTDVDFFQVPESIANREFSEFLLANPDHTKKVRFIVRSIFLQGLLTMDSKSIPKRLSGIARFREFLDREASARSVDTKELALRYAMQLPWAWGLVLGVNSLAQLKECFNILNSASSLNFEFLSSFSISDSTLVDPRKWNSIS